MRLTRIPFVLSLALGAAAAPALSDGRRVPSPTLDDVTLHVETISKDAVLAFRRFGTDDADLGTGADPKKEKYHAVATEMKEFAPELFETGFRGEVERDGTFDELVVLTADDPVPDGAILVEGRFTMLNPGSKGKRFWVGMGAGKSKVCIDARVVDTDGELAAEIEHCRVGTVGFVGGDSAGLMATDVRQAAQDLADFLSHFALGVYEGR